MLVTSTVIMQARTVVHSTVTEILRADIILSLIRIVGPTLILATYASLVGSYNWLCKKL